jgi:hypothetical protein
MLTLFWGQYEEHFLLAKRITGRRLMRMMLRIHIDACRGAALEVARLAEGEWRVHREVRTGGDVFALEGGRRTGFFVFDMESSHECTRVAEAFFDTGCDVHLSLA